MMIQRGAGWIDGGLLYMLIVSGMAVLRDTDPLTQ